MKKRLIAPSLLLFGGALAIACSKSPTTPPPAASEEPHVAPKPSESAAEEKGTESPIERAIAASDRSEEDRKLDAGRKPALLLDFFQVKSGQRVAELAAGQGYTTELLARVVGSEGKVYGQNSPFILQRFAEGPWAMRLASPVMANVERIDTEFDAPFPASVDELDAVFLILFYHDTVWFETDRASMNRAVFEALKPGGIYAIVDHSAKEGDGVSQAKTLHRIEESVVRKEVEAAGFVFDAEADFLRNPEDTRDWNASPSAAGERRGESDRFVLRFLKPKEAASEPTGDGSSNEMVVCEDPRNPMCTREYRPVCADVDTGVRCVKAPCPATEKKTFGNGCTACADPKVVSYTPGACPGESKARVQE